MNKFLTIGWIGSLSILILNGMYSPYTAIKYSKGDIAVYNSFIKWKNEKPNEYRMVLSERVVVEKQEQENEAEEPKDVKGMNLGLKIVKKIQQDPIKIKSQEFKKFRFDKNELVLIEDSIEDFKERQELKNDIQNFASGFLVFCLVIMYVNRRS